MQDMPTGDYKHITGYNWNEWKYDIVIEKIFGFVEVDIQVPDELYNYFSEMSPIYKNVEIDETREEIIGSHMFNYAKSNGISFHKTNWFNLWWKDLYVYSFIKWYLEHGLNFIMLSRIIVRFVSKPWAKK